jgi:hypothetical protein
MRLIGAVARVVIDRCVPLDCRVRSDCFRSDCFRFGRPWLDHTGLIGGRFDR